MGQPGKGHGFDAVEAERAEGVGQDRAHGFGGDSLPPAVAGQHITDFGAAAGAA